MNIIMLRTRAARKAGCIAVLLSLGACSQARTDAVALEPTNGTVCSLDGMVLKEHPGPKAQIHYAEGKPDFFCDLMELFGAVLMPEQKRRVAAVFVQDMAKTSWDHPDNNWIDARTAVYVVGSKKPGSMGPTFGSFGSMQDAESFMKKEGGKIVRFDQVTPAMTNKTTGAHGVPKSH